MRSEFATQPPPNLERFMNQNGKHFANWELRSTFVRSENSSFNRIAGSLGSWFPFREYKIPPPRKSRKITQKLQFGPPQDHPENYRKIT